MQKSGATLYRNSSEMRPEGQRQKSDSTHSNLSSFSSNVTGPHSLRTKLRPSSKTYCSSSNTMTSSSNHSPSFHSPPSPLYPRTPQHYPRPSNPNGPQYGLSRSAEWDHPKYAGQHVTRCTLSSTRTSSSPTKPSKTSNISPTSWAFKAPLSRTMLSADSSPLPFASPTRTSELISLALVTEFSGGSWNAGPQLNPGGSGGRWWNSMQ